MKKNNVQEKELEIKKRKKGFTLTIHLSHSVACCLRYGQNKNKTRKKDTKEKKIHI